MTWYSKFVHKHVRQLKHLLQRGMQSYIAYGKPSNKRRSWLVGSSMLLVMAPISAMALHTQDKQSNSIIDSFTSTDELVKQTVNLNVESSLGQPDQDSQSSSDSNQSDGEESISDDNDISLQATINGQDATVKLNGSTTNLNPVQDSYHKTVKTENGTTNIDVSIKNGGANASGTGNNSSSSINITTGSSYEDSHRDEHDSNESHRLRDR